MDNLDEKNKAAEEASLSDAADLNTHNGTDSKNIINRSKSGSLKPGEYYKLHKKALIAAVCALAAVIAGTAAALILPGILRDREVPGSADPIKKISEPKIEAPRSINAAYITMGTDVAFTEDWQSAVDSALQKAKSIGLNSVFVPVHVDGKAIYSSSTFEKVDGNDYLKYITEAGHNNAMTVFISVDPLLSADGTQYMVDSSADIRTGAEEISNICKVYGVDGVVLAPSALKDGNPEYTGYYSNGSSMGYEKYSDQALRTFQSDVAAKVRTSGGGVCVGMKVSRNAYDTAAKLADNSADFILVEETPASEFNESADRYIHNISDKKPVYFCFDTAGADKGSLSVAEIVSMCEHAIDAGNNALVFNSLSAMISGSADFTELNALLISLSDESSGIRVLTVTSPSAHEFSTYSDAVNFIGSSDPTSPLTLNGENVERTDTGYFSVNLTLKPGKNVFTFEHKGTKDTYTVTYNKVLIKSIYPSKDSYYNGGASVTVGVVAYEGCALKARLGDTIVEMVGGSNTSNDTAEQFVTYTAEFTMPAADSTPREIGRLIVTATREEETETKSGGRFTVRALSEKNGTENKAPLYEDYPSGYGIMVGVGDKYVAEVARYQTETLDIITPTDERSRPTNAYLPQGTVDYCDGQDIVFYNPESGKTQNFRNLRYGKRVYSDTNIKIFKAKLPDRNTVTAVSAKDTGRHTVLTFDVMWKAPFNVSLSPQIYSDPYPAKGRPNYSISAATYEYVDIEFCYTVSGQGKVEFDSNPIFRQGEWVRYDSGNYALRLWLKTPGKFYGWTAEYNKNDQLEFYFLDPYQATESMNDYGYSLKGALIMIDPGHGGSDIGAVGSSKQYPEAVLNLMLSRKIQRELENLGANVVMTRTDNSKVSLNDRNRQTVALKPDIFVSVHRNSTGGSASARGYENYYFYPFSKALAESVHAKAKEKFTVDRGVLFYPFQVTRVSCCPAILTENGFVSNSAELEMIKSDAHNEELAKATVQGIVDYFASIKQ